MGFNKTIEKIKKVLHKIVTTEVVLKFGKKYDLSMACCLSVLIIQTLPQNTVLNCSLMKNQQTFLAESEVLRFDSENIKITMMMSLILAMTIPFSVAVIIQSGWQWHSCFERIPWIFAGYLRIFLLDIVSFLYKGEQNRLALGSVHKKLDAAVLVVT